jgi:hypothetical protein
MPLQNIANPIYVIAWLNDMWGSLVSLTVAYPGLCKFAMAHKKLFLAYISNCVVFLEDLLMEIF